MTIAEFTKWLQKHIDSGLWVKPHPVATDVAGVYWRNHSIGVTVPARYIEDDRHRGRPGYCDINGVGFRTLTEYKDFCKEKYELFRRGKIEEYKK